MLNANYEGEFIRITWEAFRTAKPQPYHRLGASGALKYVREKFSLQFRNHCVGRCSPVKSDRTKNETSHQVERWEQCESLGTPCCCWGVGTSAPGTASWPLQALPSHRTHRSRQGITHCASSGHTQQGALEAGGPQTSEVRLMATKKPVVVSGHALGVQNIEKLHPS